VIFRPPGTLAPWYASQVGPVPRLLAALLVSAACGTQRYEKLTATAEPLRARFNADAGQARVVMLVAPT
jgi:hypothetical protein